MKVYEIIVFHNLLFFPPSSVQQTKKKKKMFEQLLHLEANLSGKFFSLLVCLAWTTSWR